MLQHSKTRILGYYLIESVFYICAVVSFSWLPIFLITPYSTQLALLLLFDLQDLAAAERGKRQAQSERDETADELSAASLARNSLLDEKKRLEARVAALEDEMEEEAGNAEIVHEKARKLQSQVDQLQLDLGNEKALSSKYESARNQLEKQNKEFKLRVAELEELSRKGNKNQVSALESKVRAQRQCLAVST